MSLPPPSPGDSYMLGLKQPPVARVSQISASCPPVQSDFGGRFQPSLQYHHEDDPESEDEREFGRHKERAMTMPVGSLTCLSLMQMDADQSGNPAMDDMLLDGGLDHDGELNNPNKFPADTGNDFGAMHGPGQGAPRGFGQVPPKKNSVGESDLQFDFSFSL